MDVHVLCPEFVAMVTNVIILMYVIGRCHDSNFLFLALGAV